jgi:hypothetical protein
MSQQKRNPDVDFGFHATIPRAVRTHYKQLSPMQKWLYVCLKDLCGEHGTCYRTTRVLALETDISTGLISESIPQLHNAGLIHAEKKIRKEGGKPVWHITIVDIWPANGKLHPTKRSRSEQERSAGEQTSGNVHHVNNNVHVVNKPPAEECSAGERECSPRETEEGSGEAVSSFEEGSGEAGEGANAPTPAHLKEIVDEKLEEIEAVQRQITGEHEAVQPNETPYHIAAAAIRNDDDGEDTAKRPAVRLQAVAAGQAPSASLPIDAPVRQTTVSEHTPGHQASPSSLDPEPAQAVIPPTAGSVASGTTTAQASGFVPPERPKRPRAKRPPTMPVEPPKTVTLTPQEAAFWALWCNLFFNKDIAPDLTMTAYGHVKRLAPYITTAEQMESLTKKARKDLEENTGIKRKDVHLGNCVKSYPGWKQEQSAQGPPSDERPPDKYTAASRDKARSERGLQRLRDKILAEGGTLPS